jgi:hypothetical protein
VVDTQNFGGAAIRLFGVLRVIRYTLSELTLPRSPRKPWIRSLLRRFFFFVGFEDGDYGYRAVQAEPTILQVIQAEAQHPNLILKNAERLLNRAPNVRQQAKYEEQTRWILGGTAVRNRKKSRNRARKIPH